MKREKNLGRGPLSRRDILKISGFLAIGLILGSLTNMPLTQAKDIYPSGKITFIVAHSAGGAVDMFARGISPYISKYLKEGSPEAQGGDILIRNEAAAAGRKGYNMMFNAKPDGYTIGTVDSSVVTDNFLETPEIDYAKFTYLSRAYIIMRVVITPAKGFKNWDEVVNEMKKGPIKMGVGAFGRGNHVSAIILNEKVGTRFKLIVFPGLAETMGALIRGDVQVAFTGENAAIPLIDANEVRVLLVFSATSERTGVVTIRQLGSPELAEQFSTYRFIVAPLAWKQRKRIS